QSRNDANAAIAERDVAESAISALGAVAHDAVAHTAAQNALAKARKALAMIEQINRDLARRPAAEIERDEALAQIAIIAQERSRLESARSALAFDPVALARASDEEQAALAAERNSLEARSSKLEAHRDALLARDRLLEEIAHINRLAERADARNRDADQLDV